MQICLKMGKLITNRRSYFRPGLCRQPVRRKIWKTGTPQENKGSRKSDFPSITHSLCQKGYAADPLGQRILPGSIQENSLHFSGSHLLEQAPPPEVRSPPSPFPPERAWKHGPAKLASNTLEMASRLGKKKIIPPPHFYTGSFLASLG